MISAGSSCEPCATQANEPIPKPPQAVATLDLDRHAVELAERAGGLGEVARGHLVGGRVLQIARRVDRAGDDLRLGDDRRQVVVRADDERLEPCGSSDAALLKRSKR